MAQLGMAKTKPTRKQTEETEEMPEAQGGRQRGTTQGGALVLPQLVAEKHRGRGSLKINAIVLLFHRSIVLLYSSFFCSCSLCY